MTSFFTEFPTAYTAPLFALLWYHTVYDNDIPQAVYSSNHPQPSYKHKLQGLEPVPLALAQGVTCITTYLYCKGAHTRTSLARESASEDSGASLGYTGSLYTVKPV
jgi:hypothetical protein